MKKLILVSLLAAAVAMPAVAEEMKKPTPADLAAANAAATGHDATAAKATAEGAMTATSPAAGTKKEELKDGSWAQIEADGSVKVSKDGGKTWMAAPDGTWETKMGTKLMTKGGKEMK
jgi:hypothetical protein